MSKVRPKVIVIIPNWNGIDHILDCLESLRAIEYTNFEVIVVDNNSEDRSPEAVAGRFPDVQIIRNAENLGFAEGCNVGIREAIAQTAEYVWLLNSDAIVDPQALDALVGVAEQDSSIGMTGSKVYHYDDRDLLWGAGMKISWVRGETYPIGWHEPDGEEFEQVCDVEALSGCSLLVKTSLCKKAGLLDKDYFLYAEEIEWCVRSRKYGFRCVVVPGSIVFHKEGASSGTGFRPIFSYYNTRNMLRTISKTFSFPRREVYLAGAIAHKLWKWRRDIGKAIIVRVFGVKGYQYDAAMLLGILDFVRKRNGMKSREVIMSFQNRA